LHSSSIERLGSNSVRTKQTLDEQSADYETRDDEEDVNSDEPSAQEELRVIEDDRQDRESAHQLDIGPERLQGCEVGLGEIAVLIVRALGCVLLVQGVTDLVLNLPKEAQ
jgi:hypothetical protein